MQPAINTKYDVNTRQCEHSGTFYPQYQAEGASFGMRS